MTYLSGYEACSPPPRFLAAPLPPPRPESGPRVGGSRRMARCYARDWEPLHVENWLAELNWSLHV